MLVIFAVILIGCDPFMTGDDDPGNGMDFDEYRQDQDAEGNLVIKNNSGSELFLYRGQNPLRIIPNSIEDYRINIENSDEGDVDLRLFVTGNIDNPQQPPSEAFKRFVVVLSKDTEIYNQVTWVIDSSTTKSTTGALVFNYVGGTNNNVDVYLNNKTGAKIGVLRPGTNSRTFGLAYGNYTLLYRYWYSDPNSADGVTELGWVEVETVGGNEVPIYAILNSNRVKQTQTVPHWNNVENTGNQYATLNVRNTLSVPVVIYANGQPIEDVIYTDKPVDNLSTIPASGGSADFLLQVTEQAYLIQARDLVTTEVVDSKEFTLTADSTISWEVDSDPSN